MQEGAQPIGDLPGKPTRNNCLAVWPTDQSFGIRCLARPSPCHPSAAALRVYERARQAQVELCVYVCVGFARAGGGAVQAGHGKGKAGRPAERAPKVADDLPFVAPLRVDQQQRPALLLGQRLQGLGGVRHGRGQGRVRTR